MTTNVDATVPAGAAAETRSADTPFKFGTSPSAGTPAVAAKETKGERRRAGRMRKDSMWLTDRDVEVVRWVYEARVTTREQVQRLFFTSGGRTRCQHRLALLLQHRYLDRLEGRPKNAPDVFFISRHAVRGVRLLRALGVDDPLNLQAVASEVLQHRLDLMACKVQFLAATQVPGLSLDSWRDEESLVPVMAGTGIVPDGYIEVVRGTAEGEKRSPFFLEVERSDKSERALREKFQRLGAFYYGGEYERRFGVKALRVLVLMGSGYGILPERRCGKLAALAAETNVTFLRFAPLETFLALSPGDTLSAPIWRRPGDPHLIPLISQEA